MSDSTKFNTVLERHDMKDGSEIVLCDRGEEFMTGRYVTWSRCLNDGDTYHGHYNQILAAAVADYIERTTNQS